MRPKSVFSVLFALTILGLAWHASEIPPTPPQPALKTRSARRVRAPHRVRVAGAVKPSSSASVTYPKYEINVTEECHYGDNDVPDAKRYLGYAFAEAKIPVNHVWTVKLTCVDMHSRGKLCISNEDGSVKDICGEGFLVSQMATDAVQAIKIVYPDP